LSSRKPSGGTVSRSETLEPVRRRSVGGNEPAVPHVSTAVDAGVAVEQLAIRASGGHTHHIAGARHRREVGDGDGEVHPVARPAQQRHHAVLGVVTVDPAEAAAVEVHLMQRRLVTVHRVEIADPALQPLVLRVGELPPVEAGVVVPLVALAELGAHEHQLLARMGEQVAVERAQRRVLLPRVARHLLEHRPLAVDDLVVRERQHEVLGERIEHRERDLAVMPAPVHGILAHVGEHVVHPAHVPLVGEAEAAVEGRTAHRRPRRGLLGHRDRARAVDRA
jgi:hypothetical protein